MVEVLDDFVGVERLAIVEMMQQIVDDTEIGSDLGGENIPIDAVDGPDSRARHLVLVRRADPAARRPDRIVAAALLRAELDPVMVGEDQVCAIGDPEPALGLDALGVQAVDLGEEGGRINNDAVSDDAFLAGPEDPGRHEVQHLLDAVVNDGMAGVVAALKARNHVELLGQPVDDLAFAFVAPLGADEYHVGHDLWAPGRTASASITRGAGGRKDARIVASTRRVDKRPMC